MSRAGGRILLSRSYVSSMAGACTCPINYQGVVSVEKGGVIIRYKLAEFINTVLRRGTPLSRSHVSSMTGGCTCPIYYEGVVSIEKGSVIMRYKLPELIKIVSQAGNRSPAAMFSSLTREGVEPCSPAAMFQV